MILCYIIIIAPFVQLYKLKMIEKYLFNRIKLGYNKFELITQLYIIFIKILEVEMIKSYLKKLQNEYLEDKLNVEREINNIQIRIKENEKFIELLEETNDMSFESFTPREVHTRNKDKIIELKEEHRQLNECLEKQKIKYDELVQQLDELNEVIEYYKTDIMSKKVSISEDLQNSITEKLQTAMQKIEFCNRLVDIDSVRCKLELNMISDILCDVIKETEKNVSRETLY